MRGGPPRASEERASQNSVCQASNAGRFVPPEDSQVNRRQESHVRAGRRAVARKSSHTEKIQGRTDYRSPGEKIPSPVQNPVQISQRGRLFHIQFGSCQGGRGKAV